MLHEHLLEIDRNISASPALAKHLLRSRFIWQVREHHPEAGEVIDAALLATQEALAKGDDVRLLGFGTFLISQRAAGDERNPRTGETVNMPASNVPRFKAGLTLKEAVNK